MNPYRKNNLKIESPGLGQILIQPQSYNEEEAKKTDILLIPLPLAESEIEATEECLANTQVPAFCPKSELPRLDARGFGSYRFHRLETFEEISFKGGSIAFYPAKLPDRSMAKRIGTLFSRVFTTKYDHQAFHLLIQGYNEESLLFLASPDIDAVEWSLLVRSKPTTIVGSGHYKESEWINLGQKYKKEIVFQDKVSVLKPKAKWKNNETQAAEKQANSGV